jgi:hypothetical protein
LSITGLRTPPDRLQQREVLHVAGADLQHVGVLRDDLDVLGVDDLGHDRQAGALARLGEDLRPFSPSPWKAYGEVRGLYAPPRSIVAPAATPCRRPRRSARRSRRRRARR